MTPPRSSTDSSSTGSEPPASTSVEVDRERTAHRPVDTSELFFDLVFVFAITQLSGLIRHEPTWHGLAQFAALLTLVYWTWTVASIHASLRDMTMTWYRMVLFSTSLAALVMALAMPRAFEDRGLVFAAAYLTSRIIILLGMMRHDRRGIGPSVISILLICPAIVVGALLDPRWQLTIWAAAAVAELLTPRIERRHLITVRYDAEHVVERFGLLVLLALGESLVAIGEPLIEATGLSGAVSVVLASSFALVVGLWWLYFHHTSALLLRLLESTRFQADVVRQAMGYAHLVLVGGVIASAAALHEAMAEPETTLSVALTLLLVSGPVLMMLTIAGVRWGVFHLPYYSRLAGGLLIVALVPLLFHVPAFLAVAVLAVTVAAVCVWETVHPRSAGIPHHDDFLTLE